MALDFYEVRLVVNAKPAIIAIRLCCFLSRIGWRPSNTTVSLLAKFIGSYLIRIRVL